ncbi:DNA repair protein RadC [Buttiauxella sp. A2-C1_F]|uniref:JAB domain-containing protein n=1 Tax=Buttiauxella sp. A2-C1_F TaxID=2904526 RepID=UPI001E30FA37|nr:DNA repair protein RadC [Buttiauxella sp. A2-C1_F]MCE0845277.1 DNA repair protein RadC [Buttiauxella sp. A2-C1_F]
MTFIASDRSGHYQTQEPVSREEIIRFAHTLLARQFRNRRKITSSEDVRQWLVMKLALETRETFGVIMLSQQHHILGYQTLFTGTLSQTMVYPREIVSLALIHNAAAVILVHNHPSGEPEPSQADKFITQKITDALALLDIRVTDHLIVGGDSVYSFAEHGLL